MLLLQVNNEICYNIPFTIPFGCYLLSCRIREEGVTNSLLGYSNTRLLLYQYHVNQVYNDDC